MKYLIAFFLLCTVTFSDVCAQTSVSTKRDSSTWSSTDKHSVATNRFFDNWFISIGGGAQLYFGDHNKQMEFGDRLTPSFDANIGKWFTPGIGTRLGAGGLKAKGLTQNGAYQSGGAYPKIDWDGYWLSMQEIEYYHLRGDVLFNLSNLFGGYRPKRVFELIPYVGLGWITATNGPKEREVTANVGLMGNFRLDERWSLGLDVRGALMHDRFDGEVGNRRNDGLLAAHVGLTYRFKKRTWDKPTTTTVVVQQDREQIVALRSAVDSLSKQNDVLQRQLAEAKSAYVTEVVVEKDILVAPVLVTFPINKATVSNEARVNIGFLADVIKRAGAKDVFHIMGYADRGTGTQPYNYELSKKRAEAIYDILTKEFGVPSDRLKKFYHGGVPNMFYNDPRLSRAVIVRSSKED